MTKHLVSIIIPVYNVSDYVEECLQSVAAQTYTDIECIIVDDCGTDDSMQKVERFITNYHGPIAFKILHHRHNCGLSAARNTGMDAATGEYIYFIDSDDYIYPYSIDVLVKAIEQEVDIDWSCGDFTRENPFSTYFVIDTGIYSNALQLFSDRTIYVMAWNHLYRSSFLKDNIMRFKEGILHEDVLWSFSSSCLVKNIAISKSITYYYRKRRDSICSKPLSERYTDICNVCKGIISFIFNHKLDNRKDVFCYANKELKRYYLQPFFLNQPNLSLFYYNSLRQIHYWNFWEIWSLSHEWRRLLLHFHRYMPTRIGFKYFQYVFAKCFDK